MKKIETGAFLLQLRHGFNATGAGVQALARAETEALTRKTEEKRWSAAEVIDHLNYYSRVYNEKFEAKIRGASAGAGSTYTGGWLGDYFVKSMLPRPDGTLRSKMQAPKASAPASGSDPVKIFQDFAQLQQSTVALLANAENVSLERVRVATMLPMVSLRLGDAFRFLLAHQQRHLVQAHRAIAAAGGPW